MESNGTNNDAINGQLLSNELRQNSKCMLRFYLNMRGDQTMSVTVKYRNYRYNETKIVMSKNAIKDSIFERVEIPIDSKVDYYRVVIEGHIDKASDPGHEERVSYIAIDDISLTPDCFQRERLIQILPSPYDNYKKMVANSVSAVASISGQRFDEMASPGNGTQPVPEHPAKHWNAWIGLGVGLSATALIIIVAIFAFRRVYSRLRSEEDDTLAFSNPNYEF
jgi:hypothetical protein